MVRKPKLLSSIRAKLFSAVAMLLVAVIMVVSSTYAWFTLSTAPEVTGMTTAIGANGSLEMALRYTDEENGAAGAVLDGVLPTDAPTEVRNLYWGNLVDVSENDVYGMNKITLMPSSLNVIDGIIQDSMLNVPVYGADGRVEKLDPKGVSGNFVNNNFVPGDDLGLRAVGVASGLTDRQLAYRNAKSAANTATSQAKNKASTSLNTNGSALANIAIKYGMDGGAAEYTQAEIAPLSVIIADLNGADGILAKIDYAYMQYMIAYAASAAVDVDAAWSTVEAATNATGATAQTVLSNLPAGVTVPEAITEAINKLEATKTNVAAADTALQALVATNASVTWTDLSPIMQKLANPTEMTINDFTTSEVKQNLGALVSSVTEKGGLEVTMASGAGVYADIADHCGDYSASVTIETVEYNGIVLNNMTAKMITKTGVIPQYLPTVGTAVNGAGEPVKSDAEVMPMSEFYGYILDLAFRTNASESKLLLQTEATDRIYEGNANEQTAGHGSSMTFEATSSNFSNEQVKKLMANIRIVFFDPETGAIIAEARLDTANATAGSDGVTAKMYLYEATKTITNTVGGDYNNQLMEKDGVTPICYYDEVTKKYYSAYNAEGDVYSEEIGDIYTHAGDKLEVTTGEYAKKDDSAIVALNQNTETHISVLVYLDGANLTNADVAFAEEQSVTGSMNLQFGSSATLTPMENGVLHIPAQEGETTAPTNP